LAVRSPIVALACATCAALPATARADVRPGDAVATRAYLRAATTYESAVRPEAAARIAAVEARGGRIAGECPSALTYAPRDTAFEEIGEEANISMFLAGTAPVRAATLRLGHADARLKWSDHRLTRLVRGQTAEERAAVELGPPNVCADIAGWKASAYAALPPSATKFTARVQAIASSSIVGRGEARDVVIMRLLRRYERPAERRAAKRIERDGAAIEGRLERAESAAETKLAAALGVTVL
jgi:hypothetical protein